MPPLFYMKSLKIMLIYGNVQIGNRVQGGSDLYLTEIGGDAMEKQFDFNDLMQFGLFIIALLTFMFLICQ